MRLYIKPQKLKGELQVPASKSFAHRYLIASSLSNCETNIYGRLNGKDIDATISCLNEMGAIIKKIDDNYISVKPLSHIKLNKLGLNVLESGSTLRFLIPIISALGIEANFSGEGRLSERPIEELLFELKKHGIEYSNNKLPFNTKGSLTGGNYDINGEISSQYITGLLMALPLLTEDSVINVVGDIVSGSYIDITLSVLKEFGISIIKKGNTFYIKGNQQYNSPKKVTVESDWSSACFFIAGGVLAGEIVLNGLNLSSLQGDKAILRFLKQANANIISKNGSLYIQKSSLKCINFNADDCPDIVPIMAVVLANAKGVSKIHNVDRLKIKECDRLNATIEMLDKFKIKAEYINNTLIIHGGTMIGNLINPYNDHRMAMSATIAGAIALGITIVDNVGCVDKSYPQFFDDYKSVGGYISATNF